MYYVFRKRSYNSDYPIDSCVDVLKDNILND